SYQTPGQPMAMEQASRLRDAAQQGIAATIVPHPSGSGFDVQATAALPESARSQVAQDPVAAALPYDNRVTGRMVQIAKAMSTAWTWAIPSMCAMSQKRSWLSWRKVGLTWALCSARLQRFETTCVAMCQDSRRWS